MAMAFTSSMMTNYKMGLLSLTTDVPNDKLSVQEIKGYRGISTTHTYTESGLEAMSLGSFLSSMFFTTCLSFLRSQFLNSQVPEM